MKIARDKITVLNRRNRIKIEVAPPLSYLLPPPSPFFRRASPIRCRL